MVFQSPSCPTHSLREVVSKLEGLGVQPATKLEIAHKMGYKGLHGTSYELISDSVEYGLLAKTDSDQLKLSALMLDILSPKGDEKRIKALKKAAFIPSMFEALRASYPPEELPYDTDLEQDLRGMGLNPNKISAAVSAYRDTIEFLKEEVNGVPVESLVKQDAMEPIPPDTFKSDGPENTEKNNSLVSSPLRQREEGEVAWKIADNFIQIGYTGSVTRKALQRLIRNLQVNMDDYPSGGIPEEEVIWKITDNSIQISYTGPVTRKALQRLVRHLEVNMDDYPSEERTGLKNGNCMD